MGLEKFKPDYEWEVMEMRHFEQRCGESCFKERLFGLCTANK